jgi:hypothetical protein
VQFGGQTPLNLALPLKRLGVPIIGTDPEDIDRAEDRKLFGKLLDELQIPCPPNGAATSAEQACAVAREIGYPVLVRPSYVLGGRAMVIAYDEETVRQYMREAVTFSQDRPVLVDRFLENATEVDVDALSDGRRGADRRHHGAHRRGRGAFGRQFLRAAAAIAGRAETVRTIEDYTVRLAKGLQGHRLDERAVRHPERHGVCAGSEPARLAHRALREQGHGSAAAQDRRGPDVGPQVGGLRGAHLGAHVGHAAGAAGFRQVAGIPL